MNAPAERRVLLAEAVVLHRQAYRETSLLVDVLAADRGRFRLLAKGAQRGRAPSARLLQAFRRLRLSWCGRGELPVVTAVEAVGEALPLRDTQIFCGFYLNELLLRLLAPQDPHPEVYRLYLNSLQDLAAGGAVEPILRGFELSLLEQIGYGLTLDRDIHGRAIDPGKTYSYTLETGPEETDAGERDIIHGYTLLGLKHQHTLDTAAMREAKRLMRRVLRHYLDGREIKSRELFPASKNKP